MRNKPEKKLYEVIKSRFLTDINIKIVCFLLAIVMYVLVSFSQLSEKTFVKKINLTGLKNDLIISNSLPENVKVTIKDKKSVIERISDEDLNVRLDLTEIADKGTGQYSLKLAWNVPKLMKSFFSSISVVPETLTIDVENLKEKNVPVTTPTIGDVKIGYVIKEKKITPSEVRIQGPESVIDSVKSIETERIDISEETDSFERFVKLNAKSPKIKIIGSDEVSVYYLISKKTESRTVKIRNVFIENLNNQFKAQVQNLPITITFTGSEAATSSLSENDITVSVDCSNVFIPGEYNYKNFNVDIPAEVQITSVTPKSINVKVSEKE